MSRRACLPLLLLALLAPRRAAADIEFNRDVRPILADHYLAPSRAGACVERPRSNTPQQALVLLNDPVYVEAARALAERVVRDGGQAPEERLLFAFRRVLQRPLKQYQADRKAAGELLQVGARPVPQGVVAAELAAWASVCRVLLNLHETITRN